MLTGMALLFVGAVLIMNSLWLSGKISDREIIFINVFVGTISSAVALWSVVHAADVSDVLAAAMTLQFAATYYWVAYNRAVQASGHGLGWFSLFVAITVFPMSITGLVQAESAMSVWLAVCWAAWSVLWFLYFLELALEWQIRRTTIAVTLGCGVLTGWLPGLLILHGSSV